MRQNPDYILRHTADSTVIIPVGKAASVFPGMITVNESGELLWQLLEEEQSMAALVQAFCDHYDIDPEQAQADIESFVKRLSSVNALID